MIRLIFTAILILTNYSIGASQSMSGTWKTFSTEIYSIQLPEDWEVQFPGQMGTDFMLLSPLAGEKDEFRENINLVKEDIRSFDMDLDDYIHFSEGQILKLIDGSKILDSYRISDSVPEIHRLVFIGKHGNNDLKYDQRYQLIDGKAYVLTLTCTSDAFDRYVLPGDKVMQSFSLRTEPGKE